MPWSAFMGRLWRMRRRSKKRDAASRKSAPRHAPDRGNVAVRLAADIILQPDVGAQAVDEARAEIAREHLRIVHGDDIFELVRPDLLDALRCADLIAVRRAGGVDEGLVVEADAFDHQRVVLPGVWMISKG